MADTPEIWRRPFRLGDGDGKTGGAAVVATADGGFAAAWVGADGGFALRRFDESGADRGALVGAPELGAATGVDVDVLGDGFRVAVTSLRSGDGVLTALDFDGAGGFLDAVEIHGAPGSVVRPSIDADSKHVALVFDAEAADDLVSSISFENGPPRAIWNGSREILVARAADGDELIVWNDETIFTSGRSGISVTAFDATGTGGGSFVVGSPWGEAGRSRYRPDADALTDGRFVVAYALEDVGGALDVAFAFVDADPGDGRSIESLEVDRIATDAPGDQTEPAVIALADGGFLIAWEDVSAGAVQGLRFDPAGTPVGEVFTLFDQAGAFGPRLAALPDGRLLATAGNGADGGTFATILDLRSGAMIGGEGPDTLLGGPAIDRVEGRGGDDRLIGGDADGDLMYGGADDDVLLGLGGDDQGLFGEGGDDKVGGGDGSDTLSGGSGNDTMDGGAGEDAMRGGRGADAMKGGARADSMAGGGGGDTLDGGGGDDSLSGDGGKDRLSGRGGDDFMDGGAGADRMIAGSGHDEISGGRGRDVIKAGGGRDVLRFERGDGRDTVLDWQEGKDLIRIETGAKGFRKLDIEEKGRHVVIDYGREGDSILLKRTDADELDSGDFLFG